VIPVLVILGIAIGWGFIGVALYVMAKDLWESARGRFR
jgi:hypothetical protein